MALAEEQVGSIGREYVSAGNQDCF